MEAFRRAVEARDLGTMVATLADDVVFHSPVVFREYVGRDVVAVILGAVLEVFEDFRYVGELQGGGETALVFRTRVAGKELQGIDLCELDTDGRIRRLTVFVRPLSAAMALRDAMAARLAAIDPHARGGSGP